MLRNRVLLTGGLGNQLFQLAAGLFHSGGSELEIEFAPQKFGGHSSKHNVIEEFILPRNIRIVVFRNRKTRAYHRILETALAISTRSSISKRKISSQAFFTYIAKRCIQVMSGMKGVRINSGLGFDQEFSKMGEDQYIIGYFQTFKLASKPEVFTRLYDLEPAGYNKLMEKQISEIRSSFVVILHIRLGDYLQEEDFGIPDTSYYRAAIEKILMIQSDIGIWIFSNDLDRAKSILPREFLDLYYYFDDFNFNAAETLQIMRYGSAYIIGNSTFSWWAAFLSKSNQPTIIAPSPWFMNIKEPNELCPEDWIRIDAKHRRLD